LSGTGPGQAVEQQVGEVLVDRTVNACGQVSLGQHIDLAAEILAGRRLPVRVDEQTLMFFDPTPANYYAPAPTPHRTDHRAATRLQQRRGDGRLAKVALDLPARHAGP